MLAYRLLRAANLPTQDKQLVKVTITKLKYDAFKMKLVEIFSDNTEVPTTEFNKMNIKPDPTYHTQAYLDGNTSRCQVKPWFNPNNYKHYYQQTPIQQNDHKTHQTVTGETERFHCQRQLVPK